MRRHSNCNEMYTIRKLELPTHPVGIKASAFAQNVTNLFLYLNVEIFRHDNLTLHGTEIEFA